MDREAALENARRALFLEQALKEFRTFSAQIECMRPTQPQMPQPPSLQHPEFTPTPYPIIQVPDLGTNPWYKRARICFLTSIIIFVVTLVLIPFNTPLMSVLPILGGISGLLVWLSIVCALIGFFGTDKRPEQYIDHIRKTSEYQQECARIDAYNATAFQQAQQQAQHKYQCALQTYQSSILPAYEAQLLKYETDLLPQWEAINKQCQRDIQQVSEYLEKTYAANIIPKSYRNLPALDFLVSCMESSNSSLHEAISQYEQKTANDTLKETITSYRQQTKQIQSVLDQQNEAIERLEDQLADTHRTAESSKGYSMVGAALAGYAAYKAHKAAR